jgi:hypothetical protein
MFTRYSKITPKDIQILQGIPNYEKARRLVSGLRDSLGCAELLVLHLAKYWDVSESELIASLTGKKTA